MATRKKARKSAEHKAVDRPFTAFTDRKPPRKTREVTRHGEELLSAFPDAETQLLERYRSAHALVIQEENNLKYAKDVRSKALRALVLTRNFKARITNRYLGDDESFQLHNRQ
jgi:hypothetical protein